VRVLTTPRRITLLLVAACLATRLAFFVAVQPWDPGVRDRVILRSDAVGYHALATNLATHREFAQARGAAPETLRTPLYPLFIASFYRIFGPHPWIVLLAQAALDSLSCALLFITLARFIPLPAAALGALFYAFDPFLVFFSVTLMSEILFVFACIVGLHCLAITVEKRLDRRASLPAAAAAVAFGLATLVRPIAMFLPIALCPVLLWSLRSRPRVAVEVAAAFAIAFVLTLTPWLARNNATFGAISLSTSGPYNLLVWNVGPMEMARTGRSALDVNRSLLARADRLMLEDGRSPSEANEFEKSRYHTRLALSLIAERPLAFLDRYAFGVFASFANLGTRGYADMLGLRNVDDERFDLRAHSGIVEIVAAAIAGKTAGELWIGAASASFLLASYTCLLIGVWISRGPRLAARREILVVCGAVAAYFILITGTAGLARFRIAATPFLAPFVGLGAAALAARISARRAVAASPDR
jgi:4-amino-4-deoxy-L-arabinose transferase-like glycosyltransferase